jgi:hypothetical protein
MLGPLEAAPQAGHAGLLRESLLIRLLWLDDF